MSPDSVNPVTKIVIETRPRRRPLIGKYWIQFYRPYDLDWATLTASRPYFDKGEASDRMSRLEKDYPTIKFRLTVRDWGFE